MEFGLREYLLILGSLLIVGLLVDGIRRTIKHRNQGLKLDLIAAPPASPSHSDISPPRPVKRATAEDLEPKLDRDPLFDSNDASQLNLWASEIKPETMKPVDQETLQVPLTEIKSDPLFTEAASEHVVETSPVTQEPIAPEGERGAHAARKEPTFEPEPIAARKDADLQADSDDAVEPEDARTAHEEDMAILTDGPMDAPIADKRESQGLFAGTMGRLFGFNKTVSAETSEDTELASEPAKFEGPSEADSGVPVTAESSSQAPDLSDVVVIELKPARAERFVGINLHTACLRAGLRRTEQAIYERIPMNQSQQPLFSLVNAVEPGTFEDDAKSIDASGFFLFTQLAKQSDPVFAVNELISGARSIAREIGGDIYDQAGVAISKEWIDLARAKAGHQHLMRS